MEKKIQDYLHLYLGCDLYVTEDFGYWHDDEGQCKTSYKIGEIIKGDKEEHRLYFECGIPFKPLLRPLSSMTEEEAVELIKITAWKHYGGHPHERKYETYKNSFGQIVVSWGLGVREKNVPVTKEAFYPEEITHLLSRGFDLFDLIPSGLAIDKTIQSHP